MNKCLSCALVGVIFVLKGLSHKNLDIFPLKYRYVCNWRTVFSIQKEKKQLITFYKRGNMLKLFLFYPSQLS
jgi:hypothetical protein